MLSDAPAMMHLTHPYLVHFYGINRCDHRLCLVTEYIPNGCLLFGFNNNNYLFQVIFVVVFKYFSLQMCDVMTYLESKSIIPRDLATRNCLIDHDANIVKVSDFGMAR